MDCLVREPSWQFEVIYETKKFKSVYNNTIELSFKQLKNVNTKSPCICDSVSIFNIYFITRC